MTDFEKINQFRRECEVRVASLSDRELIECFNRGIRISAWGFYRAAKVETMQKEILKRDFDSSILFDRDSNGIIISGSLAHKVVLIDGKLVRFEEFLN